MGARQVSWLDKGQDHDWFGSHFITTLVILAAVGLVSLVIWRWFQKEADCMRYPSARKYSILPAVA